VRVNVERTSAEGSCGVLKQEQSMLDRLFRRAARGQGLVEYALIIALVAVVVIGTLILLGPQISSIFQNITNNL
jgi:pilus assembly protein Flp/PilA